MVAVRALRAIGILLMAAGGALLLWALATGQASLALVVIIPIIYGSGVLVALSVLMFLAGLALVFLSSASLGPRGERPEGPGDEGSPQVKKEWGGVVLIGPVPIVFGSAGALKDRRLLVALSALSLVVLALFILTVL